MKDKRITIRIDKELLQNFLQAVEVRQDEDMSNAIRLLMRQYIKNATPETTGAADK
jgi:metal-responsive CopG/Arc/MetJ family transcriptional regulator